MRSKLQQDVAAAQRLDEEHEGFGAAKAVTAAEEPAMDGLRAGEEEDVSDKDGLHAVEEEEDVSEEDALRAVEEEEDVSEEDAPRQMTAVEELEVRLFFFACLLLMQECACAVSQHYMRTFVHLRMDG